MDRGICMPCKVWGMAQALFSFHLLCVRHDFRVMPRSPYPWPHGPMGLAAHNLHRSENVNRSLHRCKFKGRFSVCVPSSVAKTKSNVTWLIMEAWVRAWKEYPLMVRGSIEDAQPWAPPSCFRSFLVSYNAFDSHVRNKMAQQNSLVYPGL